MRARAARAPPCADARRVANAPMDALAATAAAPFNTSRRLGGVDNMAGPPCRSLPAGGGRMARLADRSQLHYGAASAGVEPVNNRSIFYGWWVVAAFSFMTFISTGIRHAVGPFLKPIVADLG